MARRGASTPDLNVLGNEARVGRYLVQVTRDSALADEQETFLAAFRDRDRRPPAGRAQTAWILGVAHNRGLRRGQGLA